MPPHQAPSPRVPASAGTRRPALPSPRAAFTLLEVMIVVGMAALVMAITIPFVQKTIRRDAIYQAVHVVEDACINARASAILNNATAELIIRPQDRAFHVRPGRASKPNPRSASSPDDGDPSPKPVSGFGAHAAKPFNGTLSDDVDIELLDVNFVEYRHAEETRVRFFPNGTSDEFTIVLRFGSLAWRKITVDIVTGLPQIEIMR